MNRFQTNTQSENSDNERSSSSNSDTRTQFLHELLYEEQSYSEKMAMIAKEIHESSLACIHRGGYDNLHDLSKDLSDFIGVGGYELADLMGYRSFEMMCLNAIEIAELHTFKLKEVNEDGEKRIVIANLMPIVTDKYRKQVDNQFTEPGVRKNVDRLTRLLDEQTETGKFPTDKELGYRFRMCESLNAIGGSIGFIELGDWIKAHRRLHSNEEMNSDNYRLYFGLPRKINIQTIIKERFRMEISCVSNESKNSLKFKLVNSLKDIQKYHNDVKKARTKYFEKMEERAKEFIQKQLEEEHERESNIIFHD